jgi:vancomycin resistance protein YoaR
LESDKLKSRLALLFALFLCISGALALYSYEKFLNSDLFAPGVEIGGIAVQGKSVDDAVKAIDLVVNKMYAAKVAFYHENYSGEFKLADLCQPINTSEIVKSIWQQEKKRGWKDKLGNLNGVRKIEYPVEIIYNPEVKARLVQEWESKWGIPFKNATLEVDSRRGLITIPGQAGIKVDTDSTFKVLPARLASTSNLTVPIILKHQEPLINEEMLKDMGELSSYSTLFNPGEVNRSKNLYNAAVSINKSIIAPQAIFSFNNTVGERTMERGYLDALVIVGNKFEPGLGGGICQVSSTLYNACLLAGLEITERSNHGLSVAYVPLGRDATVAYGVQDFKFKNNTDSPIYIRAITGGGKLTINVYGNLKNKKNISINTVIDQTLDFTTVTEQDPNLLPGEQKVDHTGHPGYVVRSFRNYLDSSGKIIKTEQLARDTYQPLNTLILEGPAIPVPPSISPNPPAVESGSGTGSQPVTEGTQQPSPSSPPIVQPSNIINPPLPGGSLPKP